MYVQYGFFIFLFDTDPAQCEHFPEGAADCISTILRKVTQSLDLYAKTSRGADPHPPSCTRGKAGRNHLNDEITPPPPH
jgi:hypothetical protein